MLSHVGSVIKQQVCMWYTTAAATSSCCDTVNSCTAKHIVFTKPEHIKWTNAASSS
jgi:hypothetical protein